MVPVTSRLVRGKMALRRVGSTHVQSLGRFVGSLLELTIVAGLLNKVEELLGESSIGKGY